MTGWRLELRAPLAARADLSGIVPARLAGLGPAEIGRLDVPLGTRRVALGELFSVRSIASPVIELTGDPRLDGVGAGLDEGTILVEGTVGAHAGSGMTGGRLAIAGDAGEGLARGMRAGRVTLSGDAGPRVGGALPGAKAGMRGGVVAIAGDAGPRAGERLRGGLILVGGAAGADAAAGMIAGTLAVRGGLAGEAGVGMRRGSLILAQEPRVLATGFGDTGEHDLIALLVLARRVPELTELFGGPLTGRARRHVGDRLVGGEGEILVLC
ncbi:formylmethanofuran dehydrogenase subunit C [Aquabacter spiritensis]|uniref:Formylmethanofuran dehydrogenase subunit C n=1 Tax=Aquabacter spiritensis TaxID=933073 RepID=A0A4R3LMW7_9HYPH|nr:formylmethanofuran dehydrogenase subunit C [Aquabacter spiritensis]TCT00986.1 formylmethanofuran dehydrogenase subunit C [Aquabacter spiritensis]